MDVRAQKSVRGLYRNFFAPLKYWLFLFFATSLTSSCVSFTSLYDDVVSPGRIQRSDLREEKGLGPLKAACSQLAQCEPETLEVIGHGAGSYRYYPIEIKANGDVEGNKWGFSCRAKARDVADLMDLAFTSSALKSIEIDVQAPPEGHPLCANGKGCLFVIHNKPDWGVLENPQHPAIGYLQRNTLANALGHFIDVHHASGRRLYLEIKSTFGCNAPGRSSGRCRELGRRVAGEIAGALQRAGSKGNQANWLTITSFSATALDAVHEGLEDNRDKVDYALIAGIYPLDARWPIGQMKGSVPLFTRELQDFAAATPWLDSIWFSPQGIPDFSRLFQTIAARRAGGLCRDGAEVCKPLTFSVATYPFSQEHFTRTLEEAEPAFTLPLASMMIDIDDKPVCD